MLVAPKKINLLVVLVFYLITQVLICFQPRIVKADTTVYEWTKVWGLSNNIALTTSTELAPDGTIYASGDFKGSSVDFDPGAGTDNHSAVGMDDPFLVKYNTSGTLLWARTWGSTDTDQANDLSIDSSGNIYITGFVGADNEVVDFDGTAGVDNKTTGSSAAYYITKYLSNGDYAWTQIIPTAYNISGVSVRVGSDGNIYILGFFNSFNTNQDFDPGVGVENHASSNRLKFFFQKYDSNGTYIWTKTAEGAGVAIPIKMAIDSSDNLVAVGNFQETVDFDASASSSTSTTPVNVNHYFFVKYDSDGNYLWHKSINSPSTTGTLYFYGVDVDYFDNIYFAGSYIKDIDFDPSGSTDTRSSLSDSQDIYFSKLSENGDYVWTKTLPAAGGQGVSGMDTSQSNRVYITGYFGGTVDFDPGAGTTSFTTTSDWDTNLFVAQYDSDGLFEWARMADGGQESDGLDVSASSTNVVVGGDAYGTVNFNPSGTADNVVGATDYGSATLTRYTFSEIPTPTPSPAPATPTPTAVPTPTVTANPVAGPSSQCTSTSPIHAPYLYSVVKSGSGATISFTQVADTVTGYQIFYGVNPETDTYAVSVPVNYSSGTIQYSIGFLSPDKEYLFSVQAVNNCAAGPRSGYLSASGTVESTSPVTTIGPTSSPSPIPTDESGQGSEGLITSETATPEASESGVLNLLPGFGQIQETTSQLISNTLETVFGESIDRLTNRLGNLSNDIQNGESRGKILGDAAVSGSAASEVVVKTEAAASAVGLATVTTLTAISNSSSITTGLVSVYSQTPRSILYFPIDLLGGGVKSLLEIPGYLLGSIAGIFLKKRKHSGVVFDTSDNKFVNGAYLLLYSKTGNLKTAFTNQFGEYEINPVPDHYILKVEKPNYLFPSKEIKSKTHYLFKNIYVHPEEIVVKTEGVKISDYSVALDPQNKILSVHNWTSKLQGLLHSIFIASALPLSTASFLLTVFAYLGNRSVFNISMVLISGLYLALTLFKRSRATAES